MPENKIIAEDSKKTLKECLEEYYVYTGLASTVNRQISLAGIAIIWLFKNPEKSTTIFPTELVKPLVILIWSLSLDLFQYFLGSLIWGIIFNYFETKIEKKKVKDGKIDISPFLPSLMSGLFFSKILFTLVAYYYLLEFFIPKL